MKRTLYNKILPVAVALTAVATLSGCFPADMSVDYGTSLGPGYISVGTSFPTGYYPFGPYNPVTNIGPVLWPSGPAPRPVAPRPVTPVRPPMRPVSPEPGPVIPSPSMPAFRPGGQINNNNAPVKPGGPR